MTIKEFQDQVTVVNLPIAELTERQRSAVHQLQLDHCFGDVPGQEVEEDFFTEPVSRVLLYYNNELIGCAGTRIRQIEYEGLPLLLGGISGVCTRTEMRGRGVATTVIKAGMQFLKETKCDVVFLSTSEMAQSLYKKLEFRELAGGFSWENIHGQVKTGKYGLLAPICSSEVAEQIWEGNSTLHVGKGYW